jgi:hypothetical protein
VSSFASLLDARDGSYGFGKDVQGAFGGAFGGLLAAAAVDAARQAAPTREPAGVDCRFLRSLPPGRATAAVEVLRDGRSLTVVRVDLRDEQGRTATTATVSLAAPDALHPLDLEVPVVVEPPRWRAWTLPPGVDASIIDLLAPRLGAADDGGVAVRVDVPWDDAGARAAEAACIVGDLCVGPPVAAACEGTWSPHPNPDITLRFAPAPLVDTAVVGVGRVAGIRGGLAAVGISVLAGGTAFASGAATSLVLRAEGR